MNAELCTLQYAVGRVESCPGARCPYWDEGVERGCVVRAIERFLLDHPARAQRLLELRADVDHARHGADEPDRWRLFYRLRNEERAAEGGSA